MITLDKCQNCGGHAAMGIRSHPKYCLRIAFEDKSGYCNDTAYYAHDIADIYALSRNFQHNLIWHKMIEQWDGSQWVLIQRVDTLAIGEPNITISKASDETR